VKPTGLEIVSVSLPTRKIRDVQPGDRILRVNGRSVRDELDFRFYGGEGSMKAEILRRSEGIRHLCRLSNRDASALSFEPMAPARCRNRCIFCFVDQLPRGLRASLYVKDEDHRFSFLYGNFVTLASLADCDLDRILEQRLHPLYVSVHATDERVRNLLLGRKKSREILETIRILANGGITLHTQVVLCPGINDGAVLVKTLEDLAGFYPAVSSIAVVPVGLTRYRRERNLHPLRSVRSQEAKRIIQVVEGMQRKLQEKHGNHLVFLADEFYLKAGRDFPPWEIYGEFPQWENGVGMIPLFHRQWAEQRGKRRPAKFPSHGRMVAVTGELAYPCIARYLDGLARSIGIRVRLIPIANRFFGRRVKVAGLVTGRDLLEQVRSARGSEGLLLVPDVMLSRTEGRFLDDLSLPDLEEGLQMRVARFRPDPQGFETALKNSGGKVSTRSVNKRLTHSAKPVK